MRKVFLEVKVKLEIEIPEGQPVREALDDIDISGDFLNDWEIRDYEVIDSK